MRGHLERRREFASSEHLDRRKLVGENLRVCGRHAAWLRSRSERARASADGISAASNAGRRNPTIISLYELANAIGVRAADLIANEVAEANESKPSDVAQPAQASPKPKSDW